MEEGKEEEEVEEVEEGRGESGRMSGRVSEAVYSSQQQLTHHLYFSYNFLLFVTNYQTSIPIRHQTSIFIIKHIHRSHNLVHYHEIERHHDFKPSP